MCVYSNIADNIYDDWIKRYHPPMIPYDPVIPTYPDWPTALPEPSVPNPLTQEEVDAVRRLLEAAKHYDKITKQPDCETEAKKEKIRKLAKELGVDITLP